MKQKKQPLKEEIMKKSTIKMVRKGYAYITKKAAHKKIRKTVNKIAD